jgi:hypothetical protein
MQKVIYLSLLLLTPLFSYSQPSDEEQIRSLIQESFDHIWSELNAENIGKYYTTDFLLLEHGEVWNNDTIAVYLNRARSRTPNPIRENTIEIIETKVNQNTAWVAYHNYATFTVDGKVVRKMYWLESATAVLTDEGWKLDMLHSTRAKVE